MALQRHSHGKENAKSLAEEILQAFATFTSIAWTIDPFLSLLPVLQTSKYPPLAH